MAVAHEQSHTGRHERWIKVAEIRTPGTTLHLKTGTDLPVPLIENALRTRLAEVEGG